MFKKASLLTLAFLLFSIIFNVFIDAQFGGSLLKTAKAGLNEKIVNPGGSRTVKASLTTIIVYPNQTIQEAIDKATSGETILVTPGIYREHINVTKPLRLVGEDPATTIIDGECKNQTIITVIASSVEITGFTIKNGSEYEYPAGGYGVQIMHSVNVTIRNNVIERISVGIFLSTSNSCNIIDNTIMNNYYYGVQFSVSSFNRICGNNITNNKRGILIASDESRYNVFYHNNFINNTNQVELYGYLTRWDNGAEGNYWSDYNGVDANGDGIGDTVYPDEWGWDKYPLIEPWSFLRAHKVLVDGQIFTVTTYCNSTVASFNFSQSGKQISFNVTGPSGNVTFCNATIPKLLLNASSGVWTVFVGDTNMTDRILLSENETYTAVYFTFSLSTHMVRIIGTDVIPEFPTPQPLMMFITATLIVIILVKKKWHKSAKF